jgi:hypothetical protein
MVMSMRPSVDTPHEGGPPVLEFSSMFSQLLKLFPRTEFQALVKQTRAERHARGFTCWGQFVAMLFCQLGRAHSLREICGGLRSSEGKLKHLGIEAPARSTLAYANEHRPWELYRAVFQTLLGRCQAQVTGRRKFRFKNKLVSLDSTVIDLCATVFDWAKFRRTKGAVKLHCLLDHDGYLPSVVVITDGKRHDVRVARTLRFEPGTVVVMDRGYVDFGWFGDLTAQDVFFVTRLKSNTTYRVVARRAVPARSGVLRDREGHPIRSFRRAWLTAGRQAGVHRVPHDFRRTAVRNLERAGVPRSTAMAMVGHRTESIYRRYAIVDEAMRREGAAKLSAFHQGEHQAHVVPLPGGRLPRRRQKNTASDTVSR